MRFTIPIRQINRKLLRRVIGVALFLLSSAGMAAHVDAWKQFLSPGKFSVTYPANWFVNPYDHDNLFLLSKKRGAEGTFILANEAVIMVQQEPSGKTSTQLIDEFVHGNPPEHLSPLSVSQKDLSAAAGCERLKQLVVKDYDPATPTPIPKGVPPKFYTTFLCEADGRIISVVLQNWSNDKQMPEYQRIALKMAQSIRILH
jgi:hypothetical protein